MTEAGTTPPPPVGSPVVGAQAETSDATIYRVGFAAGVSGAITGAVVTFGLFILAFVSGEPPSPGSVAVIGSPNPTLLRLVIPAGIVSFLTAISTVVRRSLHKRDEQIAAGLVGILFGFVVPVAYLVLRELGN